MKCPVCNAELSPYLFGVQTIDVCPQCGGIWFDSDELIAVANDMIQKDAIQDQEIELAFCPKSQPADGKESKRICPRCGISTEVFNYSYDSNVFLNKCPSCHGLWADRGELERVAQHLKGNPAVNKYVESLASELHKTGKQNVASRFLQSRLLSGLVALLYLVPAIVFGNFEIIFKLVVFLMLPLACIWFSDTMGGFTGFITFTRPAITKRSPGFLVAFVGWILLLIPLVIGIVTVITI